MSTTARRGEVLEVFAATLTTVRGECLGHPAGPFDLMGQTTYCDGTCSQKVIQERISTKHLPFEPALRLKKMQEFVGGLLQMRRVRVAHHDNVHPEYLHLWSREDDAECFARHTPFGVVRGNYLITRVDAEGAIALTKEDLFALMVKMEVHSLLYPPEEGCSRSQSERCE